MSPVNLHNTLFMKALFSLWNKRDNPEIARQLYYLPHQLRQTILDLLLQSQQLLSTRDLKLLMQRRALPFIDLWLMCKDNLITNLQVSQVMVMVAQNAETIHELTLGGSWVHDSYLKDRVFTILYEKNFPRLRKLRLQELTRAWHLLKLLQSCPALTHLEVCQPSLTDEDILSVFGASSCLRNEIFHLSIPSSLKGQGILLLLSIFKKLKCLSVSRFDAVLELLVDPNAQTQKLVSLQNVEETLKNLTCLTVGHPLGIDSVAHLTRLCPSLRGLNLVVQSIMDIDCLGSLTCLSSLKLKNSSRDCLPVSFNSTIVNLLEKIGRNLKELELDNFDSTDVYLIPRLCPFLRKLSLTNFSCMTELVSQKSYTLPMLLSLKLKPLFRHTIHPHVIEYLTREATCLEDMELFGCPLFSDDDLKRMTKNCNGLQSLQSLTLHPSNLTQTFKDSFSFSCPRLTRLDFGDVIQQMNLSERKFTLTHIDATKTIFVFSSQFQEPQ